MSFITKKSYITEYGHFIYTENRKNINIKGWDDNGKYVKTMIIPKKIYGKPVVSIDKEVFMNYNLTEVEIPDTVIEIGDRAFYGCELLHYVKLSSNLTKINKELFVDCTIYEIVIPNKVKIIESGVFFGNPLYEIIIGDNVEIDKDPIHYIDNNVYDDTNFCFVYNKNNRKGGKYHCYNEKTRLPNYIWKYQNTIEGSVTPKGAKK